MSDSTADHVCEYTPSLKHTAGTPLDQWEQVEVCMECGSEKPQDTKWADLIGIDPDYTGGMDPTEFVKKNRGEA